MSGVSAQPERAVSLRHGTGNCAARMRALLATLIMLALGNMAHADLPTPPPLPSFPATTYNITTSYSFINGGVPASTANADNAPIINGYITYASTHSGGHVEIPAGTFLSSQITMKSNVDLQIDSGEILRAIKDSNHDPT